MALVAVSADDLEQRVREGADMVDSEFVTSAEVQRFLEDGWQELYSKMVASGEDLFVRRAQIVSSAGNFLATETGDVIATENGDIITVGGVVTVSSYINMPAQMKAFRLLRHVDGLRLRKATLNDLENIQSSTSLGKPLFYRPEMDPRNQFLRLELYPQPDQSYTFDLFYVPALSLKEFLVSSYVSIPVRSWDQYLVLTGIAKCKDKEESDVGNVMKMRELVWETIKGDLIPFDRSEPDTVQQLASSGPFRDPEALLFFDDGTETFS
jgi:hypothetical protein